MAAVKNCWGGIVEGLSYKANHQLRRAIMRQTLWSVTLLHLVLHSKKESAPREGICEGAG